MDLQCLHQLVELLGCQKSYQILAEHPFGHPVGVLPAFIAHRQQRFQLVQQRGTVLCQMRADTFALRCGLLKTVERRTLWESES